jgi:hypothetical protein
MKSKAKFLFLFFIVLFNIVRSNEVKPWCWTRSMANEPSFQPDSKNGGLNWGYCQMSNTNQPVKYNAVITTSGLSNSETK